MTCFLNAATIGTMRLIAITQPHFFRGEAEQITALLRAGLPTLHLRKPDARQEEVTRLLDKLPKDLLGRIVVHDHHSLALCYPLGGIHLNGRHSTAPVGYSGQLSCSCHSLEEVEQRKAGCSYVFLSPIYDSISKQGYKAAFTIDVLRQARDQGIIDRKVVALGGISADRLPEVRALGFGGVALLGDIWRPTVEQSVEHLGELLALIG